MIDTSPPSAPPSASSNSRHARRRDIVGWLGILAGAAVFVAALAVPLDDAALLLALVLGLRGGGNILVAAV